MKLNSSSFTTVLLSHAHCIYPVSLFIVDQFPCHLQRSFTLFKYVWTSHLPGIYTCSLFPLIGSVLLASLSLVNTLTPILRSFNFTQATWYLLFLSWPLDLPNVRFALNHLHIFIQKFKYSPSCSIDQLYLLFLSMACVYLTQEPFSHFTLPYKVSNVFHPARLINCTCCSSPWPACTPCLEPSWPAFSGTRCPRTDQPSTTEEQIQSEFLHSINISVVLLIGQTKACWLIFFLFFSSLSSSWRSSPWQACRFCKPPSSTAFSWSKCRKTVS